MNKELITMTQKELERYEIIKRLIKKEINGTEAAKQLNLSVRQIKNLKSKVKKYGVKGIIHGNRGKESNNKMPEEKTKQIERIVKKKYYDFGPTFASEKLEENHQLKIDKEKLRQLMTDWDLWKQKPRKKNKEYRSWRPRPERPKKIKMKVVALAKTKPSWKPPVDHPWRRWCPKEEIKVEEFV